MCQVYESVCKLILKVLDNSLKNVKVTKESDMLITIN